MLNVVADKEGIGAAVLIRSCAPISGNFDVALTSSGIWIVFCEYALSVN